MEQQYGGHQEKLERISLSERNGYAGRKWLSAGKQRNFQLTVTTLTFNERERVREREIRLVTHKPAQSIALLHLRIYSNLNRQTYCQLERKSMRNLSYLQELITETNHRFLILHSILYQ